MYFCYSHFTPILWLSWLRRFAREQRQGKWIVSLDNHSAIELARYSLNLRQLRCPVEVVEGSDMVTFEFIPT